MSRRRERGEGSATDGCSEGSAAGEREREWVSRRRAPVRDEQEERGEVRRRWLEEGRAEGERER